MLTIKSAVAAAFGLLVPASLAPPIFATLPTRARHLQRSQADTEVADAKAALVTALNLAAAREADKEAALARPLSSPGFDDLALDEEDTDGAESSSADEAATPYGKQTRQDQSQNTNQPTNRSRRRAHPYKRTKYKAFQTAALMDWHKRNEAWPYPTDHDFNLLMQQTDLSKKQIKNWFTNRRKRLKASRLGAVLPNENPTLPPMNEPIRFSGHEGPSAKEPFAFQED